MSRRGRSSSTKEESLADSERLQTVLAELASVKQSLAALQKSHDSLKASNDILLMLVLDNHKQLTKEVNKLHYAAAKHYIRITSLSSELIVQIMSWIHPFKVWKLRGLSRLFRDILSSTTFAALNLTRFVPHPNTYPAFIKGPWDHVFFDGPVSYQSVYGSKFMYNRTHVDWEWPYALHCPLPKSLLPHLTNLVKLSLRLCFITGSIGCLQQLEILWLPKNLLSGPIPPVIGNLNNLRSLNLSENARICGVFPVELCSLALLEHLTITDTDLMGPIPPEVGNMKNLVSIALNLRKNPESPTYILPELCNLPRLTILGLCDCNLVGSIPRELGQSNLTELYLCDNGLAGPVPEELLSLDLKECSFEGNPNLTFSFQVPSHWET